MCLLSSFDYSLHKVKKIQMPPSSSFFTRGILISLVSTHVVCERLSAMQQRAKLPEFLVQISLRAHTQVFPEYWYGLPPPPPYQ